MTEGLSPREKRTIAEQAELLRGLRDRLSKVERAQDTRWTTIKQGEGPKIVDEHGNVVGEIGGQDGLYGHSDRTKPPTPAAPLVEGGAGFLRVTIVEGSEPRDAKLYVIHASTEQGYQVNPGTSVGSILPGDSSVTINLPGGVYHVRAQWMSLAGVHSDASEPVTVEVSPMVDEERIQEVIDDAQARIDAAREDLDNAVQQVQDLAMQWDEADFPALKVQLDANDIAVADAVDRLDAAEQALSATEAALGDLRDIRLPELRDDLASIEGTIADHSDRIQNAHAAADNARSTAENLRDVTLPALEGRLADNEAALDDAEDRLADTRLGMENLRDVRLPDLQDALNSGLSDANEWREVGAISASSLRVGNWSNMIPDPEFATDWWTRGASTTVLPSYTRNGVTRGPVLEMLGTAELTTQFFPAVPGARFVLTFDHEAGGTDAQLAAADYQFYVGGVQADGTWVQVIGDRIFRFANRNWRREAYTFTIPDVPELTQWRVQWRVNNLPTGVRVRIANPSLRERVDANMIVDGSVSARHIMAEEVAAAVGQFLEIRAEQIDTEGLAAHLATIIQLDAGQITSGKIDTSRLDAETVAAEVANFLTLDALEINVEQLAGQIANVIEVTAESISSGAISTRHLAIGDFENLLNNDAIADFRDHGLDSPNWISGSGAAAGWTVMNNQAQGPVVLRYNATGHTGTSSLRFAPTGLGVPVQPGDAFYVKASAWVGAGSATTLRLRARYTNETGGDVARQDIGAITTGGFEYQWTVPNNTARQRMDLEFWAEPGGTGNANIGTIRFRRMHGGELIVDGAVKARHVVADEIAAAVGEFLELHASQVVAGTIDADRLNVTDIAARIATVIQLNANRITTGTLGASRINVASLFADTGFINNLRSRVIEAIQITTQRIITGDIIATGTIDVEHLNVTEQLTAAFAQFLEIEAGMIKSNAFEGGTFTGGTFDGSVVRGGRFETHSAENQGVKITPDGRITVYNAAGNAVFNGSTQGLSLGGRISAWEAPNLPRITLKPAGEAQSGGGTTNAGVFFIRDGSSGIPALSVVAGMYVQNPANTGAESLRLRGQNGGSVVIDTDVNFDARGSRTDLGHTIITPATTNQGLTVRSSAGNDRLVINNSYSDFYNNVSVPDNFSIRNRRTTNATANTHIDANGIFYATTSASRYKVDQQAHEVPDALLDLEVKTWIDKHTLDRKAAAEAKRDSGEELDWIDEADLNPDLTRVAGVIAEDVEALDPTFAIYDGEGRVESVAYDRLAMAAFPLIRRQRDRITELEDTVKSMEARLDALEGRLS